MSKITVYKWKSDFFGLEGRSNGSIRILKDGVIFEEYKRKQREHGYHCIKIHGISMKRLEEMSCDSICCAVDGCEPIEHDGVCEHGFPSYTMAMGLI